MRRSTTSGCARRTGVDRIVGSDVRAATGPTSQTTDENRGRSHRSGSRRFKGTVRIGDRLVSRRSTNLGVSVGSAANPFTLMSGPGAHSHECARPTLAMASAKCLAITQDEASTIDATGRIRRTACWSTTNAARTWVCAAKVHHVWVGAGISIQSLMV
jgi:hypothetical protein